ncbi:MAG: hypothetical protein ACK2UX_19025 [Anaerolineae bacterium]
MKPALGLWLRFSYQIQHHYFLRISLRSWLWVAIVVPLGAAVLGRASWTPAAAIASVAALLWALSEWPRHRGYTLFVRERLPSLASSPPPLAVDEPLACRASGTFAVNGNDRPMLNEPARLFYVRTREHVVQVALQSTRFLLLAPSLPDEVGCWYVFFQPSSIEQVEEGRVQRGLRWDPALAITYRPEEEEGERETVYLAFADLPALYRILAELRIDLPQEALA